MSIEVERLEALFTANTAQAKAAFASLDRQISELDRKLSAFSGTEKLAGKFNSATSSTNLLAGAVGGLVTLIGSELLSALGSGASALVTYSSNLQQAKISFTTMLGSAEAATEHLQQLQKFALSTPFEFEGLIDASRRLQAMGFTAQQVIPILTDVGNAVAAVGGNREVLDRVVLALSQIQTKGKVAAQEMNQLAEAGIPAWRLLSEAIGKSRAETIKLSEDGKISSQVFLDAFQKFSRANFGGMMEQQSHTFAGAMSNLKDVLLQTASTAFEPLFGKISQIADQMSTELQQGKPTLESAFRVMVSGLVEIAGQAGGQIADALIQKIRDPRKWAIFQDDPFFVDRFTKGIFGGLPSPEEMVGLGDVAAEIPALKVPDLRVPLTDLTRTQHQNSEAAQKASEIYKDLSLRLHFYGQNTERAATEQRLLAIGMEALTSVEGQQAIRLAELIDKQRTLAQLTEIQKKFTDDLAAATETKYKGAFESLLQASEDARMQIAELAATERGGLTPLERFNLGLGAQTEGMLTNAATAGFNAEQILLLRTALEGARKAMAGFTAAQEDNKQKLEQKQLNEQRADLLRSLAGIGADLTRELRGEPSDRIRQLASELEHLSMLKINPGGLDLFVEKLRKGALDAQTALADIGTAINNAASDLGPELFERTKQSVASLFQQAKSFTELLARDDATDKYKQVLASLADVIQGDIQLTNAQRVEKLLLSDAYKNLTEAQRESLRVTAAQADAVERVRERQREMEDIARDLSGTFAEIFDSIGDSWQDMWHSMLSTARRFLSRMVEEIAFSGFYQALNGGQKPTQQQAGAYGLSALLGNALNLFRRPAPTGGAGSGLAGAINNLPVEAAPHNLPKRAFGGPVLGGISYLVGDHPSGRPNPEIFTPSRDGYITPVSDAVRSALGGMDFSGRSRESDTFILALGEKQFREAMEEYGSSAQGKRARVMKFQRDKKTIYRR